MSKAIGTVSRRTLLAGCAILPAMGLSGHAAGQQLPIPPPIGTTEPGPALPTSSLIPLKPGERLPDQYREIDPATGQQKGYAVLPAEERAKGFVRPVRQSYTHLVCGANTSMALAIAETFARNPKLYNATFCGRCKKHLPLAEFVWEGTRETVGS